MQSTCGCSVNSHGQKQQNPDLVCKKNVSPFLKLKPTFFYSAYKSMIINYATILALNYNVHVYNIYFQQSKCKAEPGLKSYLLGNFCKLFCSLLSFFKTFKNNHFMNTIKASSSLDPDHGWLVLLLYVPSQQLWSLRDGQFT